MKRIPAPNRLLSALPRIDRARFLAACERVPLTLGEVLCEQGDRIRHVYFPTEGFISLLTSIADAESLEVGLVGEEGMFGISVMLGIDVSPLRALVQGSGTAIRMKTAPFCREVAQNLALRRELDRYLYVLVAQFGQAAACTRFHVVEQRLARWLLMMRDRAHSDDFHITHDFLSNMLGVRRVGVTKAAGALQERNLISYRRGNITVIDHTGLEVASCACYRAEKNMYERFLG